MKKIMTVVLIASMLILGTVTASASIFNDIAPMASNYSQVMTDLTITSGTANASAAIYGKPGITTKTTIHLYIQQYKDGQWVDYKDWIKSEDSVNTSLSKSMAVAKGYKYRAKASCYAYAGSKCEHVTRYSAEVKY